MVGKKKGKIYVEADYDNIVLIDPNKLIIGDQIVDRLVDHEDLVFYANLETRVIPRTKLAVGEGFGSPVTNTIIASIKGDSDPFEKINFLQPKGKKSENADGTTSRYFDNSWADQITGKGSRQGLGSNQTSQSYQKIDGTKRRLRNVSNYEDTQMFGIKNISINITPNGAPGSFVPDVTITMIDVNGRTLFEQGEKSIYSVFFNMPYPIFYLTIKGYYGKAIRYTLQMTDFQCKFDNGTGNFEITIKLTSNLLSLLQDTILGYAKTAPKMFPTLVEQNKNTNNSPFNGPNSQNKVQKKQINLGAQKLEEVYQIYESKGLVPKNFPRLTIEEFLKRVDTFVEDIEKEIEKGDFVVLNDVENFRINLNELKTNNFDEIKTTFLDTENFIVYNGEKWYQFQPTISYAIRTNLLDAIKKETDAAVKNLKDNKTFGPNGSYTLAGKTITNQEIIINFKGDETYQEFDYNTLKENDYKNTYIARYKVNPTKTQLDSFRAVLTSNFQIIGKKIDPNDATKLIDSLPILFHYGEKVDPQSDADYVSDSFLYKISKAEGQLKTKTEEIEKLFGDYLENRLVQGKNGLGGLGFDPTIRNIFAIIISGCDVFYRLMNDIHTNAWDKRSEPDRIKSIIPPDKNFSIDSKNVVNYAGVLNEQNFVYPWPTYLVQRKDKDNRDLYNIEYLGDPKNESKTRAFDYNVWPEVYFTENFLDATVSKASLGDQSSYNNPADLANFSSCNAIEFPFLQKPYEITAEIPFYFELFERSILLSNYSGFFSYNGNVKTNVSGNQVDKFLSDLEALNIEQSVANNYKLQNDLKRYAFNGLSNFKNLLESQYQITWASESKGIFVTSYIDNYVKNDLEIYNLNSIDSVSITLNNNTPLNENFKKFIELDNVDLTYVRDGSCFENNLTPDVFIFLDDKKTLARIDRTEKVSNINLFSINYEKMLANSSVLALQNSTGNLINSRSSLSDYYSSTNDYKITTTDFSLTEENDVIISIVTSSLLNTPYFINSLLKGINKEKNNKKNPYTELGYIYLNSLPFFDFNDPLNYLDSDNKQQNTKTTIGSSLKKFGSIHQVPYAFILKYGSIWYRYKTYIETGNDILQDVLQNFDYKKFYDPINGNLETEYKIKNYTGGTINYKAFERKFDATDTTKYFDMVNLGVYPELISDIHYYVTGGEKLFYSFTEEEFNKAYETGKLKIGKNTNAQGRIDFGKDPNNTKRAIGVTPYFSYLTFEKDKRVNSEDVTYITIPSCGGIDINEGFLRCTDSANNLTLEMTGNTGLYNGSVRSMWGLPNFGYFNHDDIKQTARNEFSAITDPNYYANEFGFEINGTILNLLNIFNKKQLDYFEKLFLGFCNPNAGSNEVYPFIGDIINPSYNRPAASAEVKLRRLKDQIIDLLSLTKSQVTLVGNENQDGMALANQNSKTIFDKINRFIKNDVILKIGNPLEFDRKLYGSLTTIPEYKINNPLTFNSYKKGSLPGDGVLVGANALQTSQVNNKDAWDALKLNVGVPVNKTIIGNYITPYSDSGNSITDFFIEMDIEFTKNNVETLSPLIKYYARNKAFYGLTYNKAKFQTFIDDFIKNNTTAQETILREIFSYLNNKLPNNDLTQQNVRAKVSGNVNKLATYTNLQTFNNRWIAGSDLNQKTLFEDFLFINTANSEVGDLLTLDIDMVKGVLKSNSNVSIGDIISTILEKDGTSIMYATPAYVNFYGLLDPSPNSTPNDIDAADSVFGTFTEVNYLDSRQKFIIQYIGNKSEIPSQKDNKNFGYQDDAYDLGDPANNPLRIPNNTKIDYSKNNRVVAFNVDFALRNQNIFKDISIETSNMKNSSATFEFNEQLAGSVNGDQVGQQTQSLYSFYKSQIYTCSVDMLGCAMIQPTMYFNLRHVPLFYGPYLIHQVKHDISTTTFKTSIEGTRQPKYSLPQPDRFTTFVRKNYLENFREKILNKPYPGRFVELSGSPTILDPGALPEITLTSIENCLTITNPKYSSLPFVTSATTTSASFNDISTYLGTNVTDVYRKIYILGKIMSRKYNRIDDFDRTTNRITTNPTIFFPNNNPLNFAATNEFTNPNANELVCMGDKLSSEPLFSYSDYKKCLDVEVGLSSSLEPLIQSLKNVWKSQSQPEDEPRGNYVSGLTCLFIAEELSYLNGKTATEIKDLTTTNIDNGDLEKNIFDSLYYNFGYCYDKFFQPCNQPSSLSGSTGSSNTEIVLSWKEPTLYGAVITPSDGYEYYYSTNSANPTTAGTPINALTKTITSLSPNTVYYIWIRSKCGGGKLSEWLGPLVIQTSP